jgi:hypothetical protein
LYLSFFFLVLGVKARALYAKHVLMATELQAWPFLKERFSRKNDSPHQCFVFWDATDTHYLPLLLTSLCSPCPQRTDLGYFPGGTVQMLISDEAGISAFVCYYCK